MKHGAAPGPAATAAAATVSGPSYDSQSPAYAHTLPRGTRLGEFELHDLIGEGGFGIVYLAWDASLERKVAVKEYMPSSIATRAGAQVSARSERHQTAFDAGLRSFIKEAKLLAMFDHPSLLKVYRFWEANGTAYMAMPFYEGLTLKDAVASMEKPPDEAWLLTLLVCCVWMRDEGLPWLNLRFPGIAKCADRQPAVAWLSRRLDGFARLAGIGSAISAK